MANLDIRAKILEDLYNRTQKGIETLTRPSEYAKLLGISDEQAEFNVQYLIGAGLIKGQSRGALGTTKRWSFVLGLTSYGIEAVEGRAQGNLAVNFSNIIINAPVTQSQIAAGQGIIQTQSLRTFDDIEGYIEQNITGPTADTLRSELRELRSEIEKDQVKPSRLQKIKEMCEQYGPAALIVFETIMKLLPQ
jgi:hypothetical protein